MKKIFGILVTLFLLSSSSFATDYGTTILDQKEGYEEVTVSSKTLYKSLSNSFDFFFEWPNLNNWSRVHHNVKIKWLSIDRGQIIQEVLALAGPNHKLMAHIVSQKLLHKGITYPGCRINIYATCDEQGIEPVYFESVWDKIIITIGPLEIYSFALISKQ